MQSPDSDLLVRVKKPLSTSAAVLMNDMRVWLDSQGILPIGFNPLTLDSGVAFDVHFRHPRQAQLFRAEFGRRRTF
jgi:hypothetical protein